MQTNVSRLSLDMAFRAATQYLNLVPSPWVDAKSTNSHPQAENKPYKWAACDPLELTRQLTDLRGVRGGAASAAAASEVACFISQSCFQ